MLTDNPPANDKMAFALYEDIHNGLTTLCNCHDEWRAHYKKERNLSLAQMIAHVKYCIEQLPMDRQLGFWRALEILHGTFDWMSYDEEAVALQEYEISTTI